MNIKPQNILLLRSYLVNMDRFEFDLYIADFGIARTYKTSAEVETDRRTSSTQQYAAPEVVRQDLRGQAADIFSLGCVFLEIMNARYRAFEEGGRLEMSAYLQGEVAYHAGITDLQRQLSDASAEHPYNAWIWQMLNADPRERPSAQELVSYFIRLVCCTKGSKPLEATTEQILECSE